MHFAQETTGACSRGVGVWGSARSPSFGFDARGCSVPNLHPLLKSQSYVSAISKGWSDESVLFFKYIKKKKKKIRLLIDGRTWELETETESSAIDSTTDDRVECDEIGM